jgi:uncharacterized protein
MGDISAEPSMEEILSSIKRIIAEEEQAPAGRRRGPRIAAPSLSERDAAAALPDREDEGEEVLELNDPMPPIAPARAEEPAPEMPRPEPIKARVAPPAAEPRPAPEPVAGPADPIVSDQVAQATRGQLDSLSRLLVKPEPSGDGTLEGLVRDMLRPMLRDWLDANLPPMVERMVAAEIARISGQSR